MTNVPPISGATYAPRQPARTQAAGGGFTVEASAVAGASLPTGVAAPAGVALAAAEAEERRATERRAWQLGQELLSALGRLQRALLEGGGGDRAGAEIRSLLGAIPHAHDPELAAAVNAIALRARVVLAQHEAAISQ